MKNISFKLAAVAAMAVMVTGALAQGGGGGGGGRGFGQGRMMGGGGQGEAQLINRKDVQTELKVTADQKSKLESALQKAREDQRAAREASGVNFQDMTDSERAKMREQSMAIEKKALEGVLTADQLLRLKQLAIQRAGNGAVTRPDVAKDLGITEDQKRKIADLQTKQREAMMSMFQGGGFQDMSQEERQAAMQKMQENMRKQNEIMNTEIGKILTKEQLDKLEGLKGPAFKFDPAEDNVGRRGGGGGGGG